MRFFSGIVLIAQRLINFANKSTALKPTIRAMTSIATIWQRLVTIPMSLHVVTAIGAGVGVWGVINLMEGYGGDNPASKSQGVKQLMAGGGVILLGLKVVPLLSGLLG